MGEINDRYTKVGTRVYMAIIKARAVLKEKAREKPEGLPIKEVAELTGMPYWVVYRALMQMEKKGEVESREWYGLRFFKLK